MYVVTSSYALVRTDVKRNPDGDDDDDDDDEDIVAMNLDSNVPRLNPNRL
jgi:hypothetical protein